MSFLTDTSRWRALMARDAAANGHFVYTVKTTGIYCRPTCPARLARRANVGFYKTVMEAEKAGFRPCKRCKPETGDKEDPQEQAVLKACRIIEASVEGHSEPLKLQDLAKRIGLTPRYFHKIFKDKTGFTPKEYAKDQENRMKTEADLFNFLADVEADPSSFNFDAFDPNMLSGNLDTTVAEQAPLPLEASNDLLSILFGQDFDANIQPLSFGGDDAARGSSYPPVSESAIEKQASFTIQDVELTDESWSPSTFSTVNSLNMDPLFTFDCSETYH